MLQRALSGSGGGGGGGFSFISDVTSVKCVASVNPNGSGRNLSFNNIPKTNDVVYAMVQQGYTTGTFNVGTNYNLKNYNGTTIMVLENNSVSIDLTNYSYTLSGTTLSTSSSATYSNYGLFIIAEK